MNPDANPNPERNKNNLYYNPAAGGFSEQGPLLFEFKLTGENISSCRLCAGNNHRGIEKKLETKQYNQIFPWLEKCDSAAGEINNLSFALAVENLLDLEIPDRVSWIRTIISELFRINSHLWWLASFSSQLGANITDNKLLEIIEFMRFSLSKLQKVEGSFNFIRVGGLRSDINADFLKSCNKLITLMQNTLPGIQKLFFENPLFITRTRDRGAFSIEKAVDWSLSGPPLRACGFGRDIRKTEPYCMYDEVEFKIPVGETGDAHDRCRVRFEEIKQSLDIIEQSILQVDPSGVYWEDSGKINPPPVERENSSTESLIHHYKLCREGFEIPVGETYRAVESPRGELGIFIVSDGSNKPYRCHIRPPSLFNSIFLTELLPGNYLDDAVVIIDSFDIASGEVNR